MTHVDKKPSECHFVVFNDMLVLGKKKGKKFSTKDTVDFDIATICDVPDGTKYGEQTITNGFAINVGAENIVLFGANAAQKRSAMDTIHRAIDKFKSDNIRRREEKATLVVSGL